MTEFKMNWENISERISRFPLSFRNLQTLNWDMHNMFYVPPMLCAEVTSAAAVEAIRQVEQ
jgi:hypothetical protein